MFSYETTINLIIVPISHCFNDFNWSVNVCKFYFVVFREFIPWYSEQILNSSGLEFSLKFNNFSIRFFEYLYPIFYLCFCFISFLFTLFCGTELYPQPFVIFYFEVGSSQSHWVTLACSPLPHPLSVFGFRHAPPCQAAPIVS